MCWDWLSFWKHPNIVSLGPAFLVVGNLFFCRIPCAPFAVLEMLPHELLLPCGRSVEGFIPVPLIFKVGEDVWCTHINMQYIATSLNASLPFFIKQKMAGLQGLFFLSPTRICTHTHIFAPRAHMHAHNLLPHLHTHPRHSEPVVVRTELYMKVVCCTHDKQGDSSIH